MLALSVELFNKEADIPYTCCFCIGKKCLISTDSSYYSKYIRSKKSYNGTYITLSCKFIMAIPFFFFVQCANLVVMNLIK